MLLKSVGKSLEFYYYLHYLQVIIILRKGTLQGKWKHKQNKLQKEQKEDVRSDQRSLSFRVDHCHRQINDNIMCGRSFFF